MEWGTKNMVKDWMRLHEYHVWANRKLLRHLKTVPHAFTAPVSGPFPTIARTFGHIYDVDVNWFSRMKGGSPASFGETSFAHPDEAIDALDRLHREVREFLAGQDGSHIVRYRNTKGEEFENTLSEMLLHMVNHGTYHRGNVTAMLYQHGCKSCSTDLIFFLREAK
jgi:uncharacterized damage-inducible protein DinB